MQRFRDQTEWICNDMKWTDLASEVFDVIFFNPSSALREWRLDLYEEEVGTKRRYESDENNGKNEKNIGMMSFSI